MQRDSWLYDMNTCTCLSWPWGSWFYHCRSMYFVQISILHYYYWTSLFQSVVALIRTHFEDKYADLDGQIPANIPVYPVPEHDEPRFSCFGEAEGGVSQLYPFWFRVFYRYLRYCLRLKFMSVCSCSKLQTSSHFLQNNRRLQIFIDWRNVPCCFESKVFQDFKAKKSSLFLLFFSWR